jgi:pyruvate dehydrogenase E2 component (dihydrolipoamide acetyltransferase)
MAKVVELPRLSDTMQEGAIAKWRVKLGDKVKRGQVIAEIETDKATMEFEAFDSGIVLKLVAAEGDTLPLGAPIAVLGQEGEDPEAALRSGGAPTPAPAAPAPPAASVTPPAAAPPAPPPVPPAAPAAATTAPTRVDERVAASPLARRLAREWGIDLHAVAGSGPHGRVIRADVESAHARGAATAPGAGSSTSGADADGRPFVTRPAERIKLTQMRKAIARRMSESFRDIPHFYLTASVEMDRVAALRAEVNEATPAAKVSFNDVIILGVARALRLHPRVNRSFDGDAIVQHGDIHVGVAVALDDGLIVPVLRHADQLRLTQIGHDVRDLGARAKAKELRPDEMTGSTFTVSNLGMFGIDSFAAVINPGEGAILAVGGIQDAVRPDAHGGCRFVKEMKVTLACDHRAMDGADGAKFLATLKALLERPMSLFA